MGRKNRKLTLDGIAELAIRLSNDFVKCSIDKQVSVPEKLIYKIAQSNENSSIERSARVAALKEFSQSPLKKYAFDTRRINQENNRNPRTNLQYWNRSQQFVDQDDSDRLNAFAKLLDPLGGIKKQYGKEPEYFESYARILDDLVNRVCQVDSKDVEVFKPQLAYLEQLLFARYRLSLADIKKMSKEDLRERIMQKDEHLLKRGDYQRITHTNELESRAVVVSKDGNKGITQESIINAIFGNNDFRREGEKKVERTITITIKDEVVD